ncbi:MAG: PilZ domain-containing protein, partial [Candidatus Eremiobacterota bacterium]
MDSEWGNNDRRVAPRHGLDLNRSVPARVVTAAQGAVPVALYLVDLSEGGMRINLDRKLPEGETFELILSMDGLGFSGGEVFRARCQVAW